MASFSENCYTTVIRPPKKSVQHCVTSSCQIQRVSFHNNHADLQYSIKHSKMLKRYKEKYTYSKLFNPDQCDDLFLAKNIIDEKSKFYVGKTLKQLHCTLYGEIYIEKLKNEKYSSKNDRHENLLIEIWNNLKPNEKLKDRNSQQWISIGFQVKDPATEFRGAGFLGLFNLFKFSTHPKCSKVFGVATSTDTQFFFCAAGLFFTMLASRLLKQRKVDYDFWVHENEEQLLNKFQLVYNMLFIQFIQFWLQKCENKTIMYFNSNLNKYSQIVRSWNHHEMRGRIEDSLN